METNEKSQTEQLIEACEKMAGTHYESPEWKSASSDLDWENHWPIVDGDGLLTGCVFESGESGDSYANVGDEAMVGIDDLPPEQRTAIRREQRDGTWQGYATVKPFAASEGE